MIYLSFHLAGHPNTPLSILKKDAKKSHCMVLEYCIGEGIETGLL